MARVRLYHLPEGDPCNRCGHDAGAHPSEQEVTSRRARSVLRDKGRKNRKGHGSRERHPRGPCKKYYVGVDGEGHDVCERCRAVWIPDAETCANCGGTDVGHAYTYLAAVNEEGKVESETRYAPEGLSHRECLDMLLGIPARAVCFAFMFSYDVTMITKELPREQLFYLMRPETRRRFQCSPARGGCGKTWANQRVRTCPKCKVPGTRRQWTQFVRLADRGYDFFAGSFTVAEGRVESKPKSYCKACDKQKCGCLNAGTYQKRTRSWKRRTKVWDVFKYFQSSFVAALKAWKIGTDEQVARIDGMKQKRGAFGKEDPAQVMAYCREECHLLAIMMRAVLTACKDADVEQNRGFYGAGSIASAMLKRHGVTEFRSTQKWSEGLTRAIMSAYFGGRFENSVIGIVRAPIYGDDINSAYPYALTFLPCMAHGEWSAYWKRPTLDDLRGVDLALCHFRVRGMSKGERKERAWMPLPHRDEKGSISYPSGFEGWAWREEFLAAKAGWPDCVDLLGAYVYETGCGHRPFAFMPEAYRKRTEWGKEGKGIVLKLGVNAGYGKTAQNVGDDPKYKDWVWAGNCTSRTRAQLLRAISAARDPWSVLALATDSVHSTERLALEAPEDTGTSDLKKPLGGWDGKVAEEGSFFAKPGLYWRLNVEKPEDLRARGLGRREAYKQKADIEAGWLEWDRRDYKYEIPVTSRRFFGAKTSVYAMSTCDRCHVRWPGVIEQGCPRCGTVGTQFEVKEQRNDEGELVRGKWRVRTFGLAFDPLPKRERELERGSESSRLYVRDAGGTVSVPYGGVTSPEGLAARQEAESELEQPEADVGEVADDV